MTWADEQDVTDRERGYRYDRGGAPVDDPGLAAIADAPQPISLSLDDVGGPITGDVAPAAVTPTPAVQAITDQAGDQAVSQMGAAMPALPAAAPAAAPPAAPAPTPGAAVPASSPMQAAAPPSPSPAAAPGGSNVGRSMRRLAGPDPAAELAAPSPTGSMGNPARMAAPPAPGMAQVGPQKQPSDEATLSGARDRDRAHRIVAAAARLLAAGVASPGAVIAPLDTSRDNANEEAARADIGRRTGERRAGEEMQMQRGAQQRTAQQDQIAQSDKERALSLQERGVNLQEQRAAGQQSEEQQREAGAFEGLRQLNSELPEGQRWTDDQMRVIARNPATSAQILGAQRQQQGQVNQNGQNDLNRQAAAQRQAAAAAARQEQARLVASLRHHGGGAGGGRGGAGAPDEATSREILAQAMVANSQGNTDIDTARQQVAALPLHGTGANNVTAQIATLISHTNTGTTGTARVNRANVQWDRHLADLSQQDRAQEARILDQSALPVYDDVLTRVEHDVGGLSDEQMSLALAAQKTGVTDLLDSNQRTFLRHLQSIINVQLRSRSGQAVTSNELERFKQEIGTGSLVHADQVRGALEDMRADYQRQMETLQSGFEGRATNAPASPNPRGPAGAPTAPAAPGTQRARLPDGRIIRGPAGAPLPEGAVLLGS